MSVKKKVYEGYWLRTKGTNGRVRLLENTPSKFWEFPWLWVTDEKLVDEKFKHIRITIEEVK